MLFGSKIRPNSLRLVGPPQIALTIVKATSVARYTLFFGRDTILVILIDIIAPVFEGLKRGVIRYYYSRSPESRGIELNIA